MNANASGAHLGRLSPISLAFSNMSLAAAGVTLFSNLARIQIFSTRREATRQWRGRTGNADAPVLSAGTCLVLPAGRGAFGLCRGRRASDSLFAFEAKFSRFRSTLANGVGDISRALIFDIRRVIRHPSRPKVIVDLSGLHRRV